MIVTFMLLIKLEFSYTNMFGKNIMKFLLFFTGLDLVMEQLLTRIFISEALLITPILGAIIITEFIMTMGADDF